MVINSSESRKLARHQKLFRRFTDLKNGPRSLSSIECSKNNRKIEMFI